MSDRSPQSGSGGSRSVVGWVWVAAFIALAVFVGWRLGLTDLWRTVPTPEGPVRLPNGFAGVDHPFHTVRAELLRRELAEGRILRWVGQHQGGYPVEFYPLGAAWLDLGVWALGFGALPMTIAHKFAVAAVFLLPGAAWVLLARRDGWQAGVAFLALATHVAVPGAWWHGGYTELVQWGLVTNVAGAVCALFMLLWLTAFLDRGRRVDAILAMAAGAAALLTNPRSAVALAVAAVAALLATSWQPTTARSRVWMIAGRLVLAGVGIGLLAAPELLSLARFVNLYTFVHYGGYESARAFLDSSATAVSTPVLAAGLAGMAVGLALPGRPLTRAVAIALPLYAGVTLLAAANPDSPLVPQLEATRLMPFQRLLTITLAAVFAGWLFERVAARWSVRRPDLSDAALVALGVAILAFWLRPGGAEFYEPGPPEAPQRGLFPVVGTAAPQQVDLEAAVRSVADAGSGTALLTIGSALSWHQQLWAPLWTARPLFYDDWLWYWRSDHAGPPGYVFTRGHFYPQPALALEPGYFQTHGIGAVVVAGPTRTDAAASPLLRLIRSGSDYDAYIVRDPTTTLTAGGANVTDPVFANGRAGGSAVSEGPVTARVNSFPRWRAKIGGHPDAIDVTGAGYMRFGAAAPGERVEIIYAVDALDWLGRVLALAGVVLLGWLAWPRRQRRVAG